MQGLDGSWTDLLNSGGGDFSDNFKPGAQAQPPGSTRIFAFPGGADSGAKLDCTLYFRSVFDDSDVIFLMNF